MEKDEGLMEEWAVVKRVCSRFDKRHDWNDAGSSSIGPGAERMPEEPVSTRTDETRWWLESGTMPANVVVGPSGGAALEDLAKMVHNLHQARRDSGGHSRDRRPSFNQRCMWCDVVRHV